MKMWKKQVFLLLLLGMLAGMKQSVFAYTYSNAYTGIAWNKINGKCYNAYGRLISGAITRGIDVSQWQSVIDWNRIKKSNIDFAFIRCGYSYRFGTGTGYTQDYQFVNNIKGANNANVPAGVYIYSAAKTEAEAVLDAKRAIAAVQGYKISYPIVMDMEEQWQQNLGRSTVTSIMKAFCQEIKRAGYYPMVYTNLNWYRNYFYPEQLKEYDLWVAAYNDYSTGLPADCRHTIWQATSGTKALGLMDNTGMVSGIPIFSYGGNVDINFGYVDYTKKIIPRTKASYTQNTNTTVQKLQGWKTVGKYTYYYVNGKKITGIKTINKKVYYFAKSGVLQKNVLVQNGNKTYSYYGKDGILYQNGWLTYNKHVYYMKNGKSLLGLQKISGAYYYFQSKGYRIECENIRLNGKNYYFASNGVRYQKGWLKQKIKGKYYYCYYNLNDGSRAAGWKTINGKKYYFRQGTSTYEGTRAESCVIVINKVVYAFDKNGYSKAIGKK